MIYKLLAAAEWVAAQIDGGYDGSAVDHRDGYIHLSGADQVVQTADRHFAGQTGLVLLTVAPDRCGDALRWEPSHAGALFPHLYGRLPLAAVVAARPVPENVPVADAVAALLATTS